MVYYHMLESLIELTFVFSQKIHWFSNLTMSNIALIHRYEKNKVFMPVRPSNRLDAMLTPAQQKSRNSGTLHI